MENNEIYFLRKRIEELNTNERNLRFKLRRSQVWTRFLERRVAELEDIVERIKQEAYVPRDIKDMCKELSPQPNGGICPTCKSNIVEKVDEMDLVCCNHSVDDHS